MTEVRPVPIAVFGARCVGKTSLAEGLARELRWPVFSRDPLMATLLAAGVPLQATTDINGVPAVGIAILDTLLEEHRALGLPVILECVAGPPTRARWRELAANHGARLVTVRCVCSDEQAHRRRFEDRQVTRSARGDRWGAISSHMSWDEVRANARGFDRDTDADITIDAVCALRDNIASVIRHVR